MKALLTLTVTAVFLIPAVAAEAKKVRHHRPRNIDTRTCSCCTNRPVSRRHSAGGRRGHVDYTQPYRRDNSAHQSGRYDRRLGHTQRGHDRVIITDRSDRSSHYRIGDRPKDRIRRLLRKSLRQALANPQRNHRKQLRIRIKF